MIDRHRQQLRRQAMALPLSPGVYLMKNAQNTIIYIGKAKALKNRVSQYFGSDTNHNAKTRRMVSQVDHFDYIVTDSEFEALVLECSLIKQYSPKYNILLKDDKGYHYVRVSPPPYRQIRVARRKDDDGAVYLGPYVSSFTVQEAVDEACRVFQLPTCNRTFAKGQRQRPCLHHYIGQCCAPCTGRVNEQAYDERVQQALDFLKKGQGWIVADLTRRMEQAAEALDFERAAQLRDRLHALERLSQKQKVVRSRIAEQDIFAFARGARVVAVEVFRFRGGQLVDREDHLLDPAELDDRLEAVRSVFIQRYYSLHDDIPPRITLDGGMDDRALTEQWLADKAARAVHIVQPQKGEQAQ